MNTSFKTLDLAGIEATICRYVALPNIIYYDSPEHLLNRSSSTMLNITMLSVGFNKLSSQIHGLFCLLAMLIKIANSALIEVCRNNKYRKGSRV